MRLALSLVAALLASSFSWVATAAAADTQAGPPLRIVADGQARAMVVLPAQCDPQTQAAADLLVRYVEESSGATLNVVAEGSCEPDQPPPIRIHVGPSDYAKEHVALPEDLDGDGLVICAVDDRNLAIVGPTPWGTEFGVCEFLERYVGVRWLMPGADGDDVPKHATIDVPQTTVIQQPAFFSRLMSGYRGAAQTTWARRNRMHGRVSFHHNLYRVIPPEKYGKSHPEFFPVRDGDRFIPAPDHDHGWQPCFTAPGIVDEAVKNICAYFAAHPEATSFSLGVNDSSGHCRCERCVAASPKEKNFLGRDDRSDVYYAFCNNVIDGVLKQYPDKMFGCLAYSEVAGRPTRVDVHPRLIPFMTYDRMKWVDPELRRAGHESTRRWHEKCPKLGWYDYIYGTPYCVPRVWFHHMAEYYRFGYANGVRAMYAEAYPNWGEGPKLYVALKLQWNPDQKVDRLLSDWYTRAVGPEAADDLAAYYAIWEGFWTRRVLDSDWYRQRGQYLPFYSASYLADVTDQDIAESRRLLDAVVSKAGTAKQRARAELLRRAFEYYEASAVAYRGNLEADQLKLVTAADALEAVDRAERCLRMSRKRRRLVDEEFASHPVLQHPIGLSRIRDGGMDGWGCRLLWRTFDFVADDSQVRKRVEALAESDLQGLALHAKTMLRLIDATGQSLAVNPSFEERQGNWVEGWSRWVKWGVGSISVDAKAAQAGKLGVLCDGVKRGGPLQRLPIEAGRYGAVTAVRVPEKPKENLTVELGLTLMNEDGKHLKRFSTQGPILPGKWVRLALAGNVPEAVDGEPVDRAMLIVIVDGLTEGEALHIDNVALFRLP